MKEINVEIANDEELYKIGVYSNYASNTDVLAGLTLAIMHVSNRAGMTATDFKTAMYLLGNDYDDIFGVEVSHD